MTYLDAAVTVLRTARRAMTTREIVEKAIRRDLIAPRGKTPEATMSSTLYVHVRDAETPRIECVWVRGSSRAVRDSVRWRYVA